MGEQQNGYLVTYRPGAVEYSRSHIVADRVEGWSQDYAFFTAGVTGPSHLIPRDLVLEVQQNTSIFPPAAESRIHFFIQYQSTDGRITGREGPYLSEEQANTRGAEIGERGLDWWIESERGASAEAE